MIDKRQLEQRADMLNKMAAKGIPSPDDLALYEVLYYKSLSLLYDEYHSGKCSMEEAKKQKIKLVKQYIDSAYALDLWATGAKAAVELGKLITPEADIPKLSKVQLAEKLIRFQAILNGTMQKHDDEIPKMYDRLMEELRNG